MTGYRWNAQKMYIHHNQTIVGMVEESAGKNWFAYGCMTDWQDTQLGVHLTERKAKDAVQDWVEENA